LLTISSTSGTVTNAAISSAGVITWTPTEAQGPSTNIFLTVVTDDGSPALSATNSFTVVVNEVNSPPVVQQIPDQTIALQSSMTVTNIATDPDLPANQLYFSLLSHPPGALSNELDNPPAGAKIDTNGVITWTPTPDQAPSTNIFTVIVTDNGLPPLSTTNSFMVTVMGPPVPLVIRSLTFSNNAVALTWSAVAGRTYRVQCTTDPASTNWEDLSSDIPANGSTCSCSHPTEGAPYKFYRVLQVQ